MKYRVKDLLNEKNIISHLFLDCVSDSVDGTDVIKSITSKDDYSIENTDVDIQLTFNGHEVKIDNFLNQLSNEFFRLVDQKAQEKFEPQFPKLNFEDIEELQEKLETVFDDYKMKIFNSFK